MKTHTIDFKNQLTELGRELRGVITYNDVTLEEEIYSITPHYNADLLKSVMKQLDIELSVDIPLNTIINCQIGIKVNGSYEMLNYGNYVVYKSEKQEDTNTYKLTCYDKMLYSMKKNEDLGVDYPIKIKDYLVALGNKIGLSVANTTFYNQDMKIPSELYLGQDYTYRDILDEIAQATGSIICLNENDEIQVKYPTQTNDTIDEEYLKDVNVKFGERYGAINTIVLSRSGGSDNVYYPSPLPQNPVEIKIVDNQIMNFNNRSDYLEGIYNALNGLYYYINDFTSTGILYYDVGDLYNIQVGENTYQCLMLNDEINVTTGIEEIIHTDMPEKSETDYSKADKTDMRINKTYLIVDKQNQKIESVVNSVTEQNNKISQITQTVDEVNSKISDIADVTTYGESNRAQVDLTDINQSEPIMIKVHPTSTNISYLYPSDNLYPSDTQYIPNRIIRFTRTYEEDGTTKTENIDYKLPDDLLRYSSEVYDEFYLDYDSQTCQVIKRCAYNADGTVRALGKEITTDYPYPTIALGEGNYTITLLGYDFGYLYVRLMAKNIYTTQFYTKVETDSRINQKANEINLGVNQTLTKYSTTNEMNSAITLKANEINAEVREKVGKTEVGTYIEQNTESVKLAWNQISEYIQMMIINNNASFAILDSSKKPIAYFDKTGIHFSSNNTAFGEMGVQTVDGNKFIAFSVDGKYGQAINNGMAWGIKTTTDNKFHPIFYIKNFEMGALNSDTSYGELVLSACNLILGGIETGIISGNVKLYGDVLNGMFFEDANTGKVLFDIIPEFSGSNYDTINILGNISFYANASGSNSLKIGNDENNYCLLTDNGSVNCSNIIISNGSNLVSINSDGKVAGDLNFYGLPSYQGQKLVYGENGHRYHLDWTGSRLNFWVDTTNVGTLSDKRLKTEIQDIDEDFIKAIEEIEMKQFKVANRNGLISFGILAQDLIEIFKKYGKKPFDYEIVYKTQYRTDDDTVYYAINYEQFLILKQKAMDKKLEQLQSKDKQKDEIISKLIERVEKLTNALEEIEELKKEIKKLKGGK